MDSPESDKKDVRRPMNAFLIFCKRHRAIVREKHPDLDNRSITKILGDLWANLADGDKSVYTKLAKQYKDAFMKANPDYKWYNPEKVLQPPTKMTTRPTNIRFNGAPEISLDGKIVPGKLADPSNMGGLNLLLMAGQQFMLPKTSTCTTPEKEKRVMPPDELSPKSALLELAEMCATELQLDETDRSASKTGECPTVSPSDCPSTQLDTGQSGLTTVLNDDKVATRKPKSKPTKWKMKKMVEIDSAYMDVNKSDKIEGRQSLVDFSSSKKICRMPDSHVFDSGSSKVDTEADLQVKATKPEVKKVEEVTSGGDSHQGGDKCGDGDENKVKRFRRMSNAETLAECLSDENDNSLTGTHSPDGSSASADGVGNAKVKVKMKRKNSGTETVAEKDKKTEREIAPEAVMEVSVEENKMVTPCINVPQYSKMERQTFCVGKPSSETAGKFGEKKLVLVPEFNNRQFKEEKLELDINTVPDEDQDQQPVRKSRRRNRGQRYQELIDEGIIQPSKERLAARRAEKSFSTTSPADSLLVCDETFFEEEVVELKHPPKRSASETEVTDEKKYKTGDFDLEAHIAILPACSLEQCPKGRKSVKVRHNSEGSPRKPLSNDSVSGQTLLLPPHVKVKSPNQLGEPLTGSRKRKARKHSITHLLSSKSGTDNRTLEADPLKSDTAKDPALPITKEQVATSEFRKTDQTVSIKLEPVKTDVDICPKFDKKCTKSEKEDSVLEKSSSILGNEVFSSPDKKESNADLYNFDEKEETNVVKKDERGDNSDSEQSCEMAEDSMEEVEIKDIKDVAMETTAETKLTWTMARSCLPKVLLKTEIKSEMGESSGCTAAERDTVKEYNSEDSSPLDFKQGDIASQHSVATTDADDFNKERSSPDVRGRTIMSSAIPCEKITNFPKDKTRKPVVDDDCPKRKVKKNPNIDIVSSSSDDDDDFKQMDDGSNMATQVSVLEGNRYADQPVVKETVKQEEKPLDKTPSTVSESRQTSVTMVTEKPEEENFSKNKRKSGRNRSVFTDANNETLLPFSAVGTNEQTKRDFPATEDVALIHNTNMSAASATGSEDIVGRSSVSENSTNSVTMVTDSAAVEGNEVVTVVASSSVVTEIAATMVTSPVLAVASDAGTVSSIAMTPRDLVNSVSYSATTTPTTNQVVMVSTPAACTVVNSVSMVSTPASTMINPVAMVSSPVTAVASPVSAVSSPVTAVCS